MRPARLDVAAAQQGAADETVSDHDRNGPALPERQRQELLREIRDHGLIEGDVVDGPEAVENPEQGQRIFGRLAERFCALHEDPRLLERLSGFWSGIAPAVHERLGEADLQPDLIAPQVRRGR